MTHAVTIDDVLFAVQRVTHIGVRDLKGRGQSANVREARLLAYFVATQCFNISCAAVAKAVNRDSSTVAGMVRRMVQVTRFDPQLIDRGEEAAVAIAAVALRARSMEAVT